MYQEIMGIALLEEMIQIDVMNTRSTEVIGLSQELMKPLNLDNDTIRRFFPGFGTIAELPQRERLAGLTQPQETIIDNNTAWLNPLMSQAQANTLYDLHSTKPFFVDRVNDFALSTVVFDRVQAIFVNLSTFFVNRELTNTEMGTEHVFVRPVNTDQSQDPRYGEVVRLTDDNPDEFIEGATLQAYTRQAYAGMFSMPRLYVTAEMERA